jgi:hypothetical protein
VREPWIGLVTVRPAPGTDPWDGAPGAYAHGLALAEDAASHVAAVIEFYATEGFVVEEVEEVESLGDRLRDGHASREIVEVAEARETTHPWTTTASTSSSRRNERRLASPPEPGSARREARSGEADRGTACTSAGSFPVEVRPRGQ